MKKKFFYCTLCGVIASGFLIGCGSQNQENATVIDTTKTETIANAPKTGSIPVDFPIVGTSAKAGEYILAPSHAFIEDAFKKGSAQSSFIFYSSKCLTPGTAESEVQEIGSKVMIPNSLIIPIPSAQTAKKGDILLSWWQSGSGMERAIVMDDKIPGEPIVRYLDISFDNPAKNSKGIPIGKMEEKLKPNSFVKINGMWEPGTTVAWKKEGKYKKLQVIRVEGNKLLGLGWAGALESVDKKDCTPVPVLMNVKVGDLVQVPHIGSFRKGLVKKVDNKIGRVFTEIEFGGQKQEIVVPMGDVAIDLVM